MLLDKYNEHVDALISKVRTTQRENIIKAGKMIAEAVKDGACVHIHDTGHIIDSELIFRGGGFLMYKQFKYRLEVIDPVRKRDRSDLDTSMAGLAEYAIKASGARPGDVMILGSVSGRNVPVVDLAIAAKKFGMKIIVVTSMSYTTQVKSDHPSGLRLFELADIVLDNCAPAAEAMMEVDGIEARMCAASGIAATLILWSVTCVAAEELLAMGITPSVLKSANFPGGNEYNKELIERYEKTGF
ncbi:MAG: sugar isomerase domain-containing protein [Clostridia bacterium]|nr:sugar isomerase domain-containing protein [Clostridia bacterium]